MNKQNVNENLCKEMKEDFMVSELMKHAWAAQLDILDKVIAVCEKYNLTYYLFWGSLLGAIRHKGYIPWDDDLDIAMKKDDYIRFLEVAAEELPADYEILNAYTNDEYTNYFTRLVNGKNIEYNGKRMDEYHDCPFALGLDVFPLYYMPRDEQAKDELIALVKLIAFTNTLIEERDKLQEEEKLQEVLQHNNEIAQNLVTLQNYTGYMFDDSRSLSSHLTILFDQACRLYDEEESDALVAMPEYLNRNMLFDKKWLRKAVEAPFEDRMLNVPNGYDNLLQAIYRQYWIRRRGTAAHDYPYYKTQLKSLTDNIDNQDMKEKENHQSCGDHVFLASENVQICYEEAKEFLPPEWLDKLFVLDASENTFKKKTIVLYRTDTGDLLVKDGISLDKIKSVLETFKAHKDVILWWMPVGLEKQSFAFLRKMAPHFIEEYEQLINWYREENWGILDETADIQRAINMSDAYFGDENGLVATVYKETGKPMMIQNYDILSK